MLEEILQFPIPELWSPPAFFFFLLFTFFFKHVPTPTKRQDPSSNPEVPRRGSFRCKRGLNNHSIASLTSGRNVGESDMVKGWQTVGFELYYYVTSNIDAHKYSFFPRTIKDWNSLPQHIIDSSSPSQFLYNIQSLLHS